MTKTSRPVMRRVVALDAVIEKLSVIYFWTTKDVAQDLSEFGKLEDFGNNKYHLTVDPRYVFQEVVDYISNYGQSARG